MVTYHARLCCAQFNAQTNAPSKDCKMMKHVVSDPVVVLVSSL